MTQNEQCYADLSDEELFQKIFKTETKGEYKLASSFKSINSDITVIHNDCGKEYTVNAGDFVKLKVRCSCKRDLINTKWNALRIMRDQFQNFELVEFTDFNAPVKILCKTCGKISSYSRFYTFMDRKTCKVCDPSYYDEYGFIEKVHDLVGKEYTLVSPFISAQTNVTMRHNRCGNTFKVQPRNFIRGKRCNECIETYETSEMMDYLSNRTNGRYLITGTNESKTRYITVDQKTGEKRSLLKSQVIQELSRPTFSELFVNAIPITGVRENSVQNWINQKGINVFRFDDVLSECGLDTKDATTQITDLRMKGVIRLVQPTYKIYATTSQPIDIDTIVESTFLKDKNGNIIGYYVGRRFLYEIGALTDKPEDSVLVSNVQAGKKRCNLMFLQNKVSIQPPKYGLISNDTWAIRAIFSWVTGSSYTTMPEIVEAVLKFMEKNNLKESSFEPFMNQYESLTVKRIRSLFQQ